ncbi:hypothetical protein B0I35DRAFT_517051 [Stachybotrys elegans]|uniref:RBR-type E3 ubiquitin transferase n=1 Tax=Stachybotrys elegans TaxID=80388 RepID=A0A8K0SCH6_9HYPO|nr:hypothetical protein B0I35DRAFT_517051 [Stachybotrys elegans]
MNGEELDEETLRLILELQLEDLKTIDPNEKGKHREGELPDAAVAALIYKQELQTAAQSAHDALICNSIADAVREDGAAIMASELVEQQAREDREAARRAQGQGRAAAPRDPRTSRRANSTQSSLAHVDDALLEKMLALNIRNKPGESSQQAAMRQHAEIECSICTEQHADYLLVNVGCANNHLYCNGCIARLYNDSLSDESLYPPRCCRQPISLDKVEPLLDPELIDRFQAREVEMSTSNRVYCHRSDCSNFIPPKFILADRAECPNCQAVTCAICKSAEHQGSDCPQDEALKQLEQFAAREGWQKCYACGRFIELEFGCNHMTCKCQAEFCYECGEKWKGCQCAQFREERLLARADHIVDRDPEAADLTGGQRAQRRLQEMLNLRLNHACVHLDWEYRAGAHRCEECRFLLPRFIFQCTQCRIRACFRCRMNRL